VNLASQPPDLLQRLRLWSQPLLANWGVEVGLGVVALGVLVGLAFLVYPERRSLWLAFRNWRAKPVRTLGAVTAIALGVGAVVWVTCCYESVRRTVLEWASSYIGAAQISVQSPLGRYDVLPERIVTKIEKLDDVSAVAPLLVQRLRSAVATRAEYARHANNPADWLAWFDELDVHGIDVAREPAVRKWPLVAGRMLRADDENACVLEASIAQEQGVGLGDMVLIWPEGLDAKPCALEIVGLVHRRRVERFLKGIALVQLPVLQQMANKQALVNSVDIVLKDRTTPGIQAAQIRVRAAIQGIPNAQVRTTAARLGQVQKAQEQQEVVLILLSCVAMLTALFIILSTLSMGMVERIAQMGLLRCVGTTRSQLAVLTLAEVFPLGGLGILLGVPVGLGLTALTVWLVPAYVGAFTVSWRGILLAVAAGASTALVAALLPALAAARVSPLEATRPRARRPGAWPLALAALLGSGALAAQYYIMGNLVQRDTVFVGWSATAVVLLYVVYALLAPLAVWLISRLAVPVVAGLLRVRLSLLQDQVGRAVWRSAGICCGLMVGLSLIVGLVVFNTSFKTGWQFPKQFPEGYLWSFEQIPGDVSAQVAQVPGVREYTVANAVNVVVEERPPRLVEQVYLSVTWFLGTEPDTFLDLVRLEFIEGDEQTARALLRKGGYVLVAADFARTRHKGVREVRDESGNVLISNQVRVWFNDRWTTFQVAGVIDSPALDIAAGYFQIESEAHVVATGSVIGTNADLRRLYSVDGSKLILLNFDLPPQAPPADWPPPPDRTRYTGLSGEYYNASIPLERRWQNFRERQVLREVRQRLHAPQAFEGTARELKDEIDTELTRMTYLLTAVPAVALVVAAIGVANLMTANVASRTKQIAILRAVGATRALILRLVIGEALVLGVLGSGLGLALGLHLARDTITMTQRMWGFNVPFDVPWVFVGLAVALTIGLCILAGILPARHAARTNIIDALHVA
jgi:ABC-type lipoprotein release transport system permease subunit